MIIAKWARYTLPVLAVIIIVIVGLYASKHYEKNNDTNLLNKTVTDGDISFRVTKNECGIKKIGNDTKYLNASGQYCVVSLDIDNKGDQDFQLKAPSQIAIDKDGQKYTGDAGAMYYLDNQSFIKPIKAKSTTKGQIIFDIPKDKTITSYLLHGNGGTGGAKLSIK